MLDYITKPAADGVGDFANAEEHLSVAEGGNMTVSAGIYDIYVRIAGTISVTSGGATLTAANDGDEAEFFYTGSPGGNIGITIGGVGDYAGTYTTDYLGATFDLADVQAAPICLLRPTVTGNTGEGDVLTIKGGLWIYDGPAIAPLVRRIKLNGTELSADQGGDQLTFTINLLRYSAQSFTTEETFGGTTVASTPAITLDTYTGPTAPSVTPANIVLAKNNWSDLTATSATGDGPNAQTINNVDTTKVTVATNEFSPTISAADFSGGAGSNGGWLDFNSPNMDISGGGNFCMELWVKQPASIWRTGTRFLSTRQPGDFQNGFTWRADSQASMSFYVHTGSNTLVMETGTNVLQTGVWHHICVERTGTSQWYMYVDGQVVASSTLNPSIGLSSADTSIGAEETNTANNYFDGYFGPMRLVNGESCYNGASFSPSTQY